MFYVELYIAKQFEDILFLALPLT